MGKNIILGLALMLGGLASLTSANAAPGNKTITRLYGPDMVRLLEGEGFHGAKVDNDGDVTVKMDGYLVSFYVIGEGKEMHIRLTVPKGEATLQRVNNWNKKIPYTRAHMDENAVMLEMALDVSKGVTEATVAEYMTYFMHKVRPFVKTVCE